MDGADVVLVVLVVPGTGTGRGAALGGAGAGLGPAPVGPRGLGGPGGRPGGRGGFGPAWGGGGAGGACRRVLEAAGRRRVAGPRTWITTRWARGWEIRIPRGAAPGFEVVQEPWIGIWLLPRARRRRLIQRSTARPVAAPTR